MALQRSQLDLPTQPGVYLFKRKTGKVLYVGKATNLHSRVSSYFTPNPDREMIPKLIAAADNVDCIVTSSPDEALRLERELIRNHSPRYNSMLKDDSSFPYIAFSAEEHPRVMYTRNPPEGAQLWGPFTDAAAAKQVIKLLRRQFGIRDCAQLLPQGCLSMHIGLCHAPCIDAEGYAEQIDAARRVLDGDGELLLKSLREEMDSASTALQYEQAAQIRDRVAAVRRTLAHQVIHSRFYQDCDAIGFAAQGEIATVVILHANNGSVQGQVSYPLMHRGDIQDSIIRVISEHYRARRPPRLLLTPVDLSLWIEQWLDERRGTKVEVRIPQRGEHAALRALADKNAEAKTRHQHSGKGASLGARAADECARILERETLDHLVCFDMAQLQGDVRVGAVVSFRAGQPNRKEYRTYRIKGNSLDDLQMMREVVSRWLRRQEEWPDLLLLDGGQTHLTTIHNLLEELGLAERIPLAALAKKEETLHRIGFAPIILDRRARMLVHARDEAHRFVNTFHRKRRSSQSLRDPLEQVEGLGAKKLQALLRHFGGRRQIVHASQKELRDAPGIGPHIAERIWNHLNQ